MGVSGPRPVYPRDGSWKNVGEACHFFPLGSEWSLCGKAESLITPEPMSTPLRGRKAICGSCQRLAEQRKRGHWLEPNDW